MEKHRLKSLDVALELGAANLQYFLEYHLKNKSIIGYIKYIIYYTDGVIDTAIIHPLIDEYKEFIETPKGSKTLYPRKMIKGMVDNHNKRYCIDIDIDFDVDTDVPNLPVSASAPPKELHDEELPPSGDV